MTEIIKHRGPDDEGYYFYGNDSERLAYGADTLNEAITPDMEDLNMVSENQYTLGLGYRGLRIKEPFLDYHQPMSFDNKVIVFNGSIYNLRELKNELQSLGERFSTNTDTGVIIKSYNQWGKKCVEHFNGDWAFAIWDKEKSELFCSRDRLGVKPEVNEEVLFTLLFYGIDNYSRDTFFQNIYSLGAGENLLLSINVNKSLDIDINRYWDISKTRGKNSKNFESTSNEIGLELEKSIYVRLNSDA